LGSNESPKGAKSIFGSTVRAQDEFNLWILEKRQDLIRGGVAKAEISEEEVVPSREVPYVLVKRVALDLRLLARIDGWE
jgi:autonomous glycyl radical cofactor GrcA